MDTGIVGRDCWWLSPMSYRRFLTLQRDGYLVPRYVAPLDEWRFDPGLPPAQERLRAAALADVECGGPCFA